MRISDWSSDVCSSDLTLFAAVGGREQRVVLADPDIDARIDLGPALTHDNVADDHVLTAEFFHAKATAGRIATIARGTACLFMDHDRCSLIYAAEPRIRATASCLGAAFWGGLGRGSFGERVG